MSDAGPPPDAGPNPWHRHVSPVFAVLLVVAGLGLGAVIVAAAALLITHPS